MIGRRGLGWLMPVALALAASCAGLPEAASWPRVAADDAEGLPPIARLLLPGAVVAGELGSFAYREAYSDTPWPDARGLTPVSVPAGRPQLTFALPPGNHFVRWTATFAAADDPSAEMLVPLADGSGDAREQTRVNSPPAGEWVVQLHLTFADSDGDATYYWRVAVP
ncbi:MAG TPA: hypothetical protein VM305_05815 [Candidatus Limnocylindrales bacterium]|nr:hypothetical protein [Candidatus Limnocylindrales bacterium]